MRCVGYRAGDAGTPFGEFFDPEMSALPRHVVEALEHGPQAPPILPGFDDVATLLDSGWVAGMWRSQRCRNR